MRKRFKTLFIWATVISLAISSGCSNIFTGMSYKLSDDAYYEEALKAASTYNWDAAIHNFESLSSSFLARTAVREGYAGALAGRCGLDFLVYLNSLGTSDPSSSSLFLWLMNAFNQKGVAPSSCSQAEEQIRLINGNAANRTSSQNMFMLILSMAKIGAYVRFKADNDSTSNYGDGTTDVGFDACDDAGDPVHSFTDADMTEIVTGFSLMMANFSAFGSILGAGTTGALSAVQTACGLLTPNPCDKIYPSEVTAGDIANMRDLLATSSTNPVAPVGIGTCMNPMVDQCCP